MSEEFVSKKYEKQKLDVQIMYLMLTLALSKMVNLRICLIIVGKNNPIRV